MLKRWAALPRGIRWLAGTGAVVLVLAIIWALFVPTADWLAHHDVGLAAGSLHETALDNARGRLLTLGAGLFAAGALIFTARNFTLSREGQVTDRYTKAIEQLGSDKLDVRIGGIYALERVALDSARDHATVMEVLSAFVREHSREPRPLPADHEPVADASERRTRPDVQAAVTVIGRRNAKRDRQSVNLASANLAGADLSSANLRFADLAGADLAGAYLIGADLGGADLGGADLTGAKLAGLNLISVKLDGANLTGANLAGLNLAGLNLIGVDLTGANLAGADLTEAYFIGGAVFTGADLTGARWPDDKRVPEGLQRDADTGRLMRAGEGPGPAEAG